MQPLPIAVETRGAVAAATVLWSHAGRSTLTVVSKVSFLLQGGALCAVRPTPLVLREELGAQGVVRDADLAPHKPRADITFVGAGHAMTPVSQLTCRLRVIGRWGELDRRVLVVGDRSAPASAPAPFTRMPITWDRAWGDDASNPIGVRAGVGGLPNLLDFDDEHAPACLAPVSRTWPARARFLGRGDTRRIDGFTPEMPAEISWGYFLGARADQQVPRLFGDEEIWLENLMERQPLVHAKLALPTLEVRYRGPGAPSDGARLEMRCDTLAIDGHEGIINLVFRGTMPFAERAQAASAKIQIHYAAEAEESPMSESPTTLQMPPPQQKHYPTDSGTMPVARPLISVPKLHPDDAPAYDLDDPDSVAGSTMAIDPEAAMLLLGSAKATPWDREKPKPAGGPTPMPQPQPQPMPTPPPMPAPPPLVSMSTTMVSPAEQVGRAEPARPSQAGVVVQVRGFSASALDDDDSVGSTMALTPEAAAALLARGPQPPPAARAQQPLPPPAKAADPKSRQGTLEMQRPTPDSEPPGTLVLQVPDEISRGGSKR